MTALVKWPSIENFHNIRKATTKYPHILNGNHRVTYRSKVKLHGSNSAIQFLTNDVVAQSRTRTLEGCDNAGFAAWVNEHKDRLNDVACLKGYTIFGEWSGPGVNKGCAIHQIDNRIFAVFAAIDKTSEHNFAAESDDLYFCVEPKDLTGLMRDILDIPGVYVLPWHTKDTVISWNSSTENLKPVVDELNKLVDEVETCDPWVKSVFGKEGVGEGLVYYPVSDEHEGRDNFSNLGFKIKGEKHKIVKAKAPVTIDPATAASITEFVDMVVTEARLDQGVQEACDGEYSNKKIGPFIGWMNSDIHKECKAELEVSNLTWKQVGKPITNKARSWYIMKMEEL